MKKIPVIILAFAMVFLLCGCSTSLESVKKNLEKNGYTVKERSEETVTEMQNDLKYLCGGKGKILNVIAANKDDDNGVVVIEFELRSDLEAMYKELKEDLSANEKIDLKGNILAYGTSEAVKIALK